MIISAISLPRRCTGGLGGVEVVPQVHHADAVFRLTQPRSVRSMGMLSGTQVPNYLTTDATDDKH